ncbi:MAG: hypothetical protein ABI645_01195 [Pseudomonadota bacterium]
MRILDDRYIRDLRRYQLAICLMRFEARTSTICRWTGLSRARIQALGRSEYATAAGVKPVRHRGPAPYRLDALLTDSRLRVECSLVAALMSLVTERDQPTDQPSAKCPLAAGEGLCRLYETYLAVTANPRLSFEQVILIQAAIAKGQRLSVGACASCGSLMLKDSLELQRYECVDCLSAPAARYPIPAPTTLAKVAEPLPPGYQHPLF